jgi:uncharacterized membrane protein YeaQ/YmgE (transglycosylase-associated protein family)
LFHVDTTTGFNLPTLVTAFLGSVILVALVRAFAGRTTV